MKSMILRFLGSLTWLITALASLHIGLVYWFGERADIFFYLIEKPYGLTIVMTTLWAIGLAGAYSLLLFVIGLFGKRCPCGCNACSCDDTCCK